MPAGKYREDLTSFELYKFILGIEGSEMKYEQCIYPTFARHYLSRGRKGRSGSASAVLRKTDILSS